MPIGQFLRSTTMLSGVVGASFIAVMTAQAADMPVKTPYALPPSLPAVDGINYKADVFGGALASEGIGGVGGSVSVPLGFRYGFQLDGTAASYDGRFLGSVGGHLFWRDPMVGLLGVFASHTHWSRFGGLHVNHVALEFEHYSGPWTIQGIVGAEGGNSRSQTVGGTVFTYDVKSRFFDKINLNYYVNQDTMLTVGHRYVGGKHALALGAEWARPIAPNALGSFFIEGRLGENKHTGTWAGLRIYKGNSDKSLMRRHREDDPIRWTPDTLFGIINTFDKAACPPPPSDASDFVLNCINEGPPPPL
jgi:hypothetical protein